MWKRSTKNLIEQFKQRLSGLCLMFKKKHPNSNPTKKAADFLGVFHQSETVYHWMLQPGKSKVCE